MKTARYPNHHPIQQTIFKLDLGEIYEMESWRQGDKGAGGAGAGRGEIFQSINL